MKSLQRSLAGLATLAVLAVAAVPASAADPDRNATATTRIIKPLTLAWVDDLDLGTIVLSGAGAWTGAAITIDQNGIRTCTNINVACSGTPKQARYRVTGTNNQVVTVSAPNVQLTNQNDTTKTLLLTTNAPTTVALGNSGNTGVTFGIGGSISVSSTTTDGVYNGTFNVTVNY
jgi:hypothetical protein